MILILLHLEIVDVYVRKNLFTLIQFEMFLDVFFRNEFEIPKMKNGGGLKNFFMIKCVTKLGIKIKLNTVITGNYTEVL